MKFLHLLSLIGVALIVVLLHSQASEAKNVTWGHQGPYDNLLHRHIVTTKGSWFQVTTRHVVYPSRGFHNMRNLTFIRATDHARSNGGFAALVQGGIGRRNATIRLVSDRGYGLNYTLDFYGR